MHRYKDWVEVAVSKIMKLSKTKSPETDLSVKAMLEKCFP